MRKALALPLIAGALSTASVSAQVTRAAPELARIDDEYAAFVYEGAAKITGPLADYVQSVGRRVAAQAKLSNADTFRVTLMDSRFRNASVGPSGIYLGRAYLIDLQDESELAAVLGHEIGHLTAGHAESDRIVGTLGFLATLIGYKEKRNPPEVEYEADKRGMEYMVAAGYDPDGAVSEQNMNVRFEEMWHQNGTPLINPGTHPPSIERVKRSRAQAIATGKSGSGIRNRDRFLEMLDGTMIGPDPAKGMTIFGEGFVHPVLGFRFSLPPYDGYRTKNGDAAVTIYGPRGVAEFSGGPSHESSLDGYVAYLHKRFNPLSKLNIVPTHTVINGIPAAFVTTKATLQNNQIMRGNGRLVDMSVIAYQFDPKHYYYFVSATDPGSGFGDFDQTVKSLRRMSKASISEWNRPQFVRVHTVVPGDTVQSLASRMANSQFGALAEFLYLNDLKANDTLRPGQKVKLVVWGAPVN